MNEKLIVRGKMIDNEPMVGVDVVDGMEYKAYLELLQCISALVDKLRESGFDISTIQMEVEKKRKSWQ